LSVNKRIALITTWYPPITGVAVGRMNSFANYLSEDFEVEVFCLGNTEESITKSEKLSIHYLRTNKLYQHLKSNQRDSKIIHNCKTLFRILLSKVINNPLKNWEIATLSKLQSVHEKKSFDLIISSFSPEEAHLVAINFKKIFPSIPWIADMRDEMATNPYLDLRTKNRLLNIEKEINEYANGLTTVSEPILLDFQKSMPKISIFEEIRNGFDHSIIFEQDEKKKNNVLKFGYFGSFYGLRKPDNLLLAIEKFQNINHEFIFEIHIYGAHNNYGIPYSFKDKVFKHLGLTYLKAIEEMNKMDINLLFHPRSIRKGVFSGKIFDYISAKKPIFALVDKDDVAAKLIHDLKCGYVAEFDDLTEIKEKLDEIISDFKNQTLRIAEADDIKKLHRRNSVLRLTKMIHKIISK